MTNRHKRRVRERMAATGESYVKAKRRVDGERAAELAAIRGGTADEILDLKRRGVLLVVDELVSAETFKSAEFRDGAAAIVRMGEAGFAGDGPLYPKSARGPR